jgi:hypothetical protein
LWVSITKKTLDAEFSTLDPDALCFVQAVENDGATVCWAHNDVRVVWSRARTSSRLQLAVEELVEALELFRRNQYLVHVQLMEIDKSLDL